MGRNKKKSAPATQLAQESGSDEGSDVPPSNPVTAGAPEVDGEAVAEVVAVKKKEYKGNRLQKAKKGKNGDKTSEKPDVSGGDGAAHGETPSANEDDDGLEEAGGAGSSAALKYPIRVLYCPICTFPAEMCEFSGMYEKCRPWLREHAAELANAVERGRKRRILTQKERLESMIEGRGVKRAVERVVVLGVEQQKGRRVTTTIFGMDLFGFNLKDLARDWRKSFSAGGGVRQAAEGTTQDGIEIQGNFLPQLIEMLPTKYDIPKSSIYQMEGKKKVLIPQD